MKTWLWQARDWMREHPFPAAVAIVGAAAAPLAGFLAHSETAALWTGGVVGVLTGMAIAATTGRKKG